MRRLAEEVKTGKLRPAQIDERVIAARLYAPDVPDPDLIIRTSGEMRLSNFMLWQCANATLCFPDCFWPDFTEADLDEAMRHMSSAHHPESHSWDPDAQPNKSLKSTPGLTRGE
jgi:undecaprenyl diphosphate synthase